MSFASVYGCFECVANFLLLSTLICYSFSFFLALGGFLARWWPWQLPSEAVAWDDFAESETFHSAARGKGMCGHAYLHITRVRVWRVQQYKQFEFWIANIFFTCSWTCASWTSANMVFFRRCLSTSTRRCVWTPRVCRSTRCPCSNSFEFIHCRLSACSSCIRRTWYVILLACVRYAWLCDMSMLCVQCNLVKYSFVSNFNSETVYSRNHHERSPVPHEVRSIHEPCAQLHCVHYATASGPRSAWAAAALLFACFRGM